MSRSKARDISSHQSDVTHLDAGAPLKFVLSADSHRRKSVNVDFSQIAPLERLANEIVGCFVSSVQGVASGTVQSRYLAVRRFATSLMNSVSPPPITWAEVDWPSFTNGWIKEWQTSGAADGYANDQRSHISQLFAAIWLAQKVPEFDLVEPIPNIAFAKKPDVGSIVQIEAFDYDQLDTEQAEIARRLETLTDIADPAVHSERIDLVVSVLRDHAFQEIRHNWSWFEAARAALEDDSGLDIDWFLSEYRLSRKPLRFRDGWKESLRKKRDLLRFLCHPEVYRDVILTGGRNCVKNWLKNNPDYKMSNVNSALHPTVDNVIPILTLLMVDLTLEVTSTTRMETNCCTETEQGKAVSILWPKGRSNEFHSEVRPKGSATALLPGSAEPITSYRALEYLSQLRSRFEGLIPEADKKYMFVVFAPGLGRSGVGWISESQIARVFHRFRKRHPILSKLRFAPDKLRPTGVLEEQLKNGDILKTARKARHRNLKTTQRYVDTVSVTHQGRARVREVQDLLLMNTLPPGSTLRSRLGLDDNRVKQIAEHTARSGFLEWFPTPGVSRETKVEARRSQFMDWLLSGQHEILEDPEVAAELFAYRRHLVLEAPVLRDTDEWWEVWAPTIIYLSKALQAMRPDIRIAGELLAADHQIEYMEDC
ncbi:hypothetical protein GFL72_28670 [Rhizobium leguminosarum bv. viciae]|uniref:hypothetical protein n=1 Tax=Rhizobium leguminosarum TaxID=384 RepID=UPI0014411CA4|nr:hypothetical protein [Rhizobium leguminosarum]NKK38556.1 hypothetical protein [Rhizobium leguminosarum bv. viciae]